MVTESHWRHYVLPLSDVSSYKQNILRHFCWAQSGDLCIQRNAQIWDCEGFNSDSLESILNNCLAIQLAASKQTRTGGYATVGYNWQERRNQADWSKMLYHVTLPREELDAGSMANFRHDKTTSTWWSTWLDPCKQIGVTINLKLTWWSAKTNPAGAFFPYKLTNKQLCTSAFLKFLPNICSFYILDSVEYCLVMFYNLFNDSGRLRLDEFKMILSYSFDAWPFFLAGVRKQQACRCYRILAARL